jgi:Mrp family chromosome partitioning ATPase
MVEGAVMVVRANSTPFELIKRAVDAIGRQRIIGVVLNRAESSSAADHYQYYGYGDTGDANQARP